MEKKKIFGDYVNAIRKEKHISMNVLCEGICNIQDIYNIENSDWNKDMFLQETILERLGVGAEDYEYFLFYEEYKRWIDRHQILHSIIFEKFQEAGRLLDEYFCNYVNEGNKYGLERQFYLSMLGQLERCRGKSEEVLSDIFHEAIRITVPMYGEKPIADMVLSIKELNLMLEAERYRKEGERIERYKEIVDYIARAEFDSRGKVKIYPKAVYYMCRCMKNKAERNENLSNNYIIKILRYSSRAQKTLRDNGRMYFLWEILSMREELLEKYIQNSMDEGDIRDGNVKEEKKCNHINLMKYIYDRDRKWRLVLEKVYGEFHMPKETFEYCYLYVFKGVSCINDVIRIRREMFGMSQKELCKGICDVRTLRRLENYKTSTHRVIVCELFEKLGLSGELTRTELATSSQEAKELMEKIRDLGNDDQLEETEKLLNKLKKIVFIDIPINRQAVMRKEILIQRKKKALTNKEYYRQMKKALELTLPYEYFIKEGDKYLTNEEQSFIQNMMKVMKEDSEEMSICIRHLEKIYQFYIDNEIQETVFGMYEFIMCQIGSIWGNLGEHDKADEYNRQIIEGCLRFRRLKALQDGLYDRWWNYSERKKKGIDVEKELNDEEELTACLLISRLCKLKYSEKFYRKKLKLIKSK